MKKNSIEKDFKETADKINSLLKEATEKLKQINKIAKEKNLYGIILTPYTDVSVNDEIIFNMIDVSEFENELDAAGWSTSSSYC